ncbi:unnamed protein product [Porites evermanni]|uniref:Uncharacterized protein n=1 Tax=Porites evermanni TaxID=104178 RepID=A0ABN8SZ32_9CNID|nr:unnamed protein product [Porites evermanni]
MKLVSLVIFFGLIFVSYLEAAKSLNNKPSAHSDRATIVNSGDTIILHPALRKDTEKSLHCTKTACKWKPCSYKAKDSSTCLNYAKFIIIGQGKMKGKPINSGDTVSLFSTKFGPHYKLTCSRSSKVKCHLDKFNREMTGNNWLIYQFATFQIFSRDTEDLNPVQYGDVVGLKYLFSSSKAWLTRSGKFLYPRSCSRNDKTSCAKEDTFTGFKIFKMKS